MKCVNPFVSRFGAFGCGQCMPCRLVKQRTWMHRILLESYCHASNAFVTLTYSPEVMGVDGSLRPVDAQRWLKRLRKRVYPQRVRFFLVGEYGDRFSRPHFHAALFGYPSCSGRPVCNGLCQCPACLGVRETWGFGHVSVGRLEVRSARYIARYTLKKMTSPLDARLEGRYPEFSRQSRRPGIGVDAMWDVASVLLRYPTEPLPAVLLHSGKALPLGRLLKEKIRIWSDRAKESYPQEALSVLRSFAAANNRSVQSVFQELNGPYEARLLAKLSTLSPLSTRQLLLD